MGRPALVVEGPPVPSFVILTRPPHSNLVTRTKGIPLVLKPEAYHRWLTDEDTEQLAADMRAGKLDLKSFVLD